MNSNRLISSQPSYLGKYPDQAVLTEPVTISVGVPTKEITFWQSYGFFVAVIIWPMIYVFIAVWEFWTSYAMTTIDEVVSNVFGLWFILSIAMLFFIIIIYWGHRTYKGFSVPNPWVAKNLTWQHVPIIVITEDSIRFMSNFFTFIDNLHHDQTVRFDDVEQFQLNQGESSGFGFSIKYKKKYVKTMSLQGKRLEGLMFRKAFTLYPHHNVLNGQYYIELREVLNIMNTFHKQRAVSIEYLSQDNSDNLMDIGW